VQISNVRYIHPHCYYRYSTVMLHIPWCVCAHHICYIHTYCNISQHNILSMNIEVFLDTRMCQLTSLLVFWKELLPPSSEPNNPWVRAALFSQQCHSPWTMTPWRWMQKCFSKTSVNINPHCIISHETWILQLSSHTYRMLFLQKQHHFLTITYKEQCE
jgi:hypothetical protein